MGAVLQLIKTLAGLLPPWAMAVLLVLVGVLALPGWLHSVRTKPLRNAVRRVARAGTAQERQAAEDQAMALANGVPRSLSALAEEALRLNQRGLCERAVAELEKLGATADASLYRRKLAPEAKRSVGHPLEAAIAVRRLMKEGLLPAARARLDEARARFPDDDELRALDADLGAREGRTTGSG